MKRSELEKHLGKIVEATLFDDRKITGELHKTGEEQFKDNPNLLYPHNYYFLINPQSFLFKCSHIKKIELAPSADEISSSDEIYTSIIGGRKEVVKMNDEKLTQLNELSSKIKGIKGKKAVLKKIDELSMRRGIVITDYNYGRVGVPEELSNVFFTLLKDYHQKQLDILEKEFEVM